jgi:mannose-6-phosphate isomerase-like protein (cupin superfamily)
MKNVEEIRIDDQIIAIIIYSEFSKEGIEFFTPGDFSQQLGYMKRAKGYEIQEHMHKLQSREVKYTQETLFIKRGRVRVDFYTDDRVYISSRELKGGDVILLASGGHGFEFLEETEMMEVKQGPYLEEDDKVRFKGVRP